MNGRSSRREEVFRSKMTIPTAWVLRRDRKGRKDGTAGGQGRCILSTKKRGRTTRGPNGIAMHNGHVVVRTHVTYNIDIIVAVPGEKVERTWHLHTYIYYLIRERTEFVFRSSSGRRASYGAPRKRSTRIKRLKRRCGRSR